ncbi:MAG: sigma-70 family RNA polymerase sigma factor [Planctomycetaceae bacterium]
MLDRLEFSTLIQRVRSGDQSAAAECVRLFEPEIRRAARVRLSDPQLRRIVDSMDICQSVFGRFFVHAASGTLDLDRPEQLLAMLVTMTRNRVTDLARHQQAARRDVRRDTGGAGGLATHPDPHPGPLSDATGRELLAQIHNRLDATERDLADRRGQGQSWPMIAKELGGSPDALRKKLERALDRVREDLGLADPP